MDITGKNLEKNVYNVKIHFAQLALHFPHVPRVSQAKMQYCKAISVHVCKDTYSIYRRENVNFVMENAKPVLSHLTCVPPVTMTQF